MAGGKLARLLLAAKAKRAKKEAGPSTKAPATTPDAVLAAGAEELDAERQQLLAGSDFVNEQQRSLFSLLNSYADVHLPARPYPTDASPSAPDPLMDAVLLHCLNHVTKAADRIKKNNAGFTRPKVLLLLPLRNSAFRAVRRLVRLALRETRSDSVQGKEKFLEQFTDPEEMAEEENMDEAARARLAAKPSEHRALFAGNIDDHFRLGIKVTKGAVKLFADLYQSDIIVASPVALATKLAEDKRADPHSQPDFLSSVELLHGTDIMRVRDWYLAGQAARYRQTVLLSSHASAQANALVRATANHAGGVRLQVEQPGVLGAVVPQVRQLFERFHADSPAAVGDARFEFFMRTIWPRVKDSVSRGRLGGSAAGAETESLVWECRSNGQHPGDYIEMDAPIVPEFTFHHIRGKFNRLWWRVSWKLRTGKFITMSFLLDTGAPKHMYLCDKALRALEKDGQMAEDADLDIQYTTLLGRKCPVEPPAVHQPAANIIGLKLLMRFGLRLYNEHPFFSFSSDIPYLDAAAQ
eukprot:XP_001692153.1 predicted protein [Chlamydomonas reinhardtii]